MTALQINLLPQEEFAASTLGRILTWLLSTFRIIVIVTEMIVMSSFFLRFWFDAKLTDLSEEIQQKQAIISSYSSFEKDFRLAQKKLRIFSSSTSDQKSLELFQGLISCLPENIQLNSYSASLNDLQIKAMSTNEQSIAQFIANLENKEQFKNVSLRNLETNKDDLFIGFLIKVNLKGDI